MEHDDDMTNATKYQDYRPGTFVYGTYCGVPIHGTISTSRVAYATGYWVSVDLTSPTAILGKIRDSIGMYVDGYGFEYGGGTDRLFVSEHQPE